MRQLFLLMLFVAVLILRFKQLFQVPIAKDLRSIFTIIFHHAPRRLRVLIATTVHVPYLSSQLFWEKSSLNREPKRSDEHQACCIASNWLRSSHQPMARIIVLLTTSRRLMFPAVQSRDNLQFELLPEQPFHHHFLAPSNRA